MSDLPALKRCLNCGAALSGPYCASCGQKVASRADLTLRAFLHETTEELTHIEGKVPRTLGALLFRPGHLTKEFLAGRRSSWLPPLRLYLFCSLAFFLAGPVAESISHRSAKEVAKITLMSKDGSAVISDSAWKEIEKEPVGRLLGRWVGREQLQRAISDSPRLNQEYAQARQKAMFVLLPAFAFFTMLAWRRKVPTYAGHLYLALHLHAGWFAGLAIATALTAFGPTWWAEATGLAGLAYIIWYGLKTFRVVFEDSWPRTLGKLALVTPGYLIVFFVVAFALLFFAISQM